MPRSQPPAEGTISGPKPQIETTQKATPRSRWELWASKNAKPKNHYFPRPKSQPTRFQKPGPMSTGDKKKFLHWAKKNSLPKKDHQKQVVTCKQPKAEKPTNKRNLKTMATRMRRVNRLSFPKMPSSKYVPPPQPIYPYSPKIHFRKPPHHDRGRPFQCVQLPHWWYHEELEINFWRWMRFPISRNALKYKITNSTRRMAIPKTYPVKPHCPYPPRDYSPPDRVKMTQSQWRGHLRRLDYLADASFKVTRQFKVKF